MRNGNELDLGIKERVDAFTSKYSMGLDNDTLDTAAYTTMHSNNTTT